MYDYTRIVSLTLFVSHAAHGNDFKFAGCLKDNILANVPWFSVFESISDDHCAKACKDSSFLTFSYINDCFCSDPRELTQSTILDCDHPFHHVDIQDSIISHNLCPDVGRLYCQTDQSLETRIDNIMSFMTIEDKVQTLGQRSVAGNYSDHSSLVAQEYSWWSEALHGLFPLHHDNGACGKVCPTSFAEANALSCSWNETLWYETANAISTEARAYFNERVNLGLTFYAPNLNLASHPLWGRSMETPGEDPYLAAVYAKQYIHGLQGDHPRVLKAAATPKHFIGHFFEGEDSDPWGNGTTVTRYSNDTRYSLQDLEQYYLPPFRAALKDAKAASLMCAYQSVNGVPMCANGYLLNQVVRLDWNWSGFIVSDCDAIETMEDAPFHGYSLNPISAVQDGVRAGCDQNCGDVYSTYGKQAVEKGFLTDQQIDTSIRRQLRTLFQLGLFNPVNEDPYAHLGWDHVRTRKHLDIALDGARQSIVLLQNGNRTTVLPITKGKKILLAGPMANATLDLLGNYHGDVCVDGSGDCLPTLEQALNVSHFIPGVPAGCDTSIDGIADVVDAAEYSDIIVLVLGGTCHEAEGADRDSLRLPGSQMDLFRSVYDIGKPMAVVIVNGGPYAIDELKSRGDIAILQTGFPGQAGFQAIADILLGVTNPSGKLTTTIYPESYASGKPMRGAPWMNSNLRPSEESEGRSHMFYKGNALFPFGFGLSYTTFEMDWDVSPPIWEWHYEDIDGKKGTVGSAVTDDDFYFIRVTNTGNVAGREIVQAYWSPPQEVDAELNRQLFDFVAIDLHPGESQIIRFSTKQTLKSISTVTPRGDRIILPGEYTIAFSRGHGKVLEAKVRALSYRMIRKFPSPWMDLHEVVGEACVEGASDVIPHTESFLTAYKHWRIWNRRLQHVESKMCLTYDVSSMTVYLRSCDMHNQLWIFKPDGLILPKTNRKLCLRADAHSADQLRLPVKLSATCYFANAQWTLEDDGFLRSHIEYGNPPLGQQGLCLAARSEGKFNYNN
jgi:xylan 1,4-beta-xylosidase